MKKVLRAISMLAVMAALYTSAGQRLEAVTHAVPQYQGDRGTASLEFRQGMEFYQQGSYDQALEKFRQAAASGDIQALVQIGLMYDFGKGVRQNYGEAMRWYAMAAEKGDPDAMYLMGHMFEFGEGIAIDLNTAYSWYLRSARAGHASAQYEIGRLLVSKEDDENNRRNGIDWLKLAAAQCHPKAAQLLQVVAADEVFKYDCAGG